MNRFMNIAHGEASSKCSCLILEFSTLVLVELLSNRYRAVLLHLSWYPLLKWIDF